MNQNKKLPNKPDCLKEWKEEVLPSMGIVFIGPSGTTRESAMKIYSYCEEWLQEVANIWGEARLTWAGANYGLRKIPHKNIAFMQQGKTIIPELETDIAELYSRNHPCYLTEMETQTVIWMNKKAIEANHLIRPSKIIGGLCTSMWDPSSMEKMMDYLAKDKFINRFETLGYHWLDEWRREKMATISSYRLVTAFETECRLCETLEYHTISTD